MPIRRKESPSNPNPARSYHEVERGVAARAKSTALQTVRPAPELIPGYGNISHEDLVVPRIKLLQGMSPECKPDGGSHPQGLWFHSSEGRTLGRVLNCVSLGEKKSVELWGPRNSQEEGEGILARSSDGVNWDSGYANKTIIINWNDGRRETWKTRDNVRASGFCEMIDGKPPIAGYTYRLALWLPDFPHYPASLYIVSRTATQALRDLHGRIHSRSLGGTPFYAQQYGMESVIRKGKGTLEWFVPRFSNLPPLTDKAMIDELKIRSEAIYRANVRTVDEADAETEGRYEGVDRSSNSTY